MCVYECKCDDGNLTPIKCNLFVTFVCHIFSFFDSMKMVNKWKVGVNGTGKAKFIVNLTDTLPKML